MAYILRKIGNADNIAVNYYEVDTERDMQEIDVANAPMGSRCYVINIGSTYTLNSSKEWKLVPTSGGDTPSGGTKESMVVTFTLTGTNPFKFSADIPYEDIKEAANEGRIVYAFVPSPGPVFGQLTNAGDSILQFNAVSNVGQMMNITMNSDSDITGSFIDSLYRLGDVSGGGDFDAGNYRIRYVKEPTKPYDAATKGYVDKILTAGNSDSVVIKSSTPNSTKKFRITVDDAGAISATEIQ